MKLTRFNTFFPLLFITSEFIIPSELKKFNPLKKDGKLILQYDKNRTNLKSLIDILYKNKIDFREINTSESDLEDVFLKLTKTHDL